MAGYIPLGEVLTLNLSNYLFYKDDWVTIYCGDCRNILTQLGLVDLVLTDPPYPDCHAELYGYENGMIDLLKSFPCRQFIFWSARFDFPLDYTAIHIWDKARGVGVMYERIFERNGGKIYKVYRSQKYNNELDAVINRDILTNHPSQKPIKLIRKLIIDSKSQIILDPFLGSGTTCVAAKNLNRKSIGIEISSEYCEIAVKRLRQEVFNFGVK